MGWHSHNPIVSRPEVGDKGYRLCESPTQLMPSIGRLRRDTRFEEKLTLIVSAEARQMRSTVCILHCLIHFSRLIVVLNVASDVVHD